MSDKPVGVPCSGRFLTKEEGGREQPPTGYSYSTVARINGVEVSMILDQATIRFLNPAMAMPLVSGTRIELYEGSRLVFEGKIL